MGLAGDRSADGRAHAAPVPHALERARARAGRRLRARREPRFDFDPWALGIPLFPRRWLRFMAKSELWFPPLKWILRAGGAFPVRRGQRDTDAIARAVELSGRARSSSCSPRARAARRECARSTPRDRTRARRGSRSRRASPSCRPRSRAPTSCAARAAARRVRRADPARRPARARRPRGRAGATERLMAEIERDERRSEAAARRSTATRSPTAPTTRCRSRSAARRRPANTLVGFTNMSLRLWQAERPRAVARRLGHARASPTYRHEAFEAYQSGACSTTTLLEQLDLLPGARRRARVRRRRRRRATRRTTSSPRPSREEERGGTALVATSDRDAFQLASERTTILQPCAACRELARIGPAEVRERYGVEPEQVPDFIALRGDPSDKIPGARGRRRRRRPPSSSRSTARWRRCWRRAASPPRRRTCALYRRIATLDASAPLPPLDDQSPDLGARRPPLARELGLNAARERLGAAA